ncbi:hypothetical protein [Oryzomonas rubra]|uniref:Uncharacterized protein n=1 Tax=Oryzomonas rubra TaxID=2509454 RepID=A0A5A9X5X6_9BACT|nr:hypothetical protein [Oryzomonas rubra]KAA0888063.1 hypothetical protein ET418_16825 [Oryzomonas rubra]
MKIHLGIRPPHLGRLRFYKVPIKVMERNLNHHKCRRLAAAIRAAAAAEKPEIMANNAQKLFVMIDEMTWALWSSQAAMFVNYLLMTLIAASAMSVAALALGSRAGLYAALTLGGGITVVRSGVIAYTEYVCRILRETASERERAYTSMYFRDYGLTLEMAPDNEQEITQPSVK